MAEFRQLVLVSQELTVEYENVTSFWKVCNLPASNDTYASIRALRALLDDVVGSAACNFTGAGVVVARTSARLPTFPIGPPFSCDLSGSTASTIASVSVPDSAHHDGFHILTPSFQISAMSQYFSPPVIEHLKICRKGNFGGRYLAAAFGSKIDGVLLTGIATPALGVVIFCDGKEM